MPQTVEQVEERLDAMGRLERKHGGSIETVLAHPDLASVRRWVLVTRDAHPLYAGTGFTPLAAPERYMELVRDAAAIYRALGLEGS